MTPTTPSPQSSPDVAARWATWAVRVVLVLPAWAAFAPARENGFVDLDDRVNFSENLDYRGLGWEQVRSAFTTTRLGVY